MSGPRIAIVYESRRGQVEKIARAIAARLAEHGATQELFTAATAPASLDGFDGAILGGSIHMSRHGKALTRFATTHRDQLASKPNAFFSVSLTAVNADEKSTATALGLVREFEKKTGFTPLQVATIAGALKYRSYNPFVRFVMKRIAKSQGGATDTSRDHEYTDWAAVDAYADRFLEQLRA